jgi:hypothetical protein
MSESPRRAGPPGWRAGGLFLCAMTRQDSRDVLLPGHGCDSTRRGWRTRFSAPPAPTKRAPAPGNVLPAPVLALHAPSCQRILNPLAYIPRQPNDYRAICPRPPASARGMRRPAPRMMEACNPQKTAIGTDAPPFAPAKQRRAPRKSEVPGASGTVHSFMAVFCRFCPGHLPGHSWGIRPCSRDVLLQHPLESHISSKYDVLNE